MDGTNFDDSDRLRARQGEADVVAAADPGTAGRGAACCVGKVTTVTGVAAPAFFKLEVQDLTGAETEGGAGTLTGTTKNIIAMNLGSSIPAANTYVLCTYVADRWVFRYGG